MQSLEDHAQAELARLDAQNLRRTLHETSRASVSAGPGVLRDGRRLISFSCNDYLNLATHPAIVEASIAATRQYGAGAGASRLVTGNHPLLAQLEARLAALKGTEAACVFGSGYLANTGIIPALVGKGDLVLVDALAHSCIWTGAMLSGARLRRFRHNDMDHLHALLRADRPQAANALILTDRVFSMDGDLAPTAALAAIAAGHDAWLMTDDAHGLGVLPSDHADVPLQMGTLSKAIGGYGAYLCASRAVIDLMYSRARTLIYSTALPPGVVGAAIAALDMIDDDPAYAARPLQLAQIFAEAAGLPTPASPIVPVLLGTADAALAASARLQQAGFLVAAIRPPTVPPGTARLRLTFTAGHQMGDVLKLASLIRGIIG
jgi:8-amino-7-oxononanoate synthase